MQYIAQLFLFVLCISMFKMKREHKIALICISPICLTTVSLPIPFGNANFILPICFIISEIHHFSQYIREIKRTPLCFLMIMMIIATCILLVHSPHYNNPHQFIRLFMMELFGKYFIICFGFIIIYKYKQIKYLETSLFYSIIILTLFGIQNLLTKHPLFISSTGASSLTFSASDRFRVQAMFVNPFDYGFICAIVLLFYLYLHSKHITSSKHFFIVILCCIFGIISCGCRTVILCSSIGISLYYFRINNFKNNLKIISLISILLIASYTSISPIREKINQTATMFQTDSDVKGSSIEMRVTQYLTVLYYTKDNLWYGNGKDYFAIDLGWADGFENAVDKDLCGLEGVLLVLLLEHGIIGIIFYTIFYSTLIYLAIKYKRIDKQSSALFMSILLTYLVFANATGELLSPYPTLLFSGICLKLIYIKKEQDKLNILPQK